MRKFILGVWLVSLLAAGSAAAQVGTSDATGTITDRDGNPLEGVTVSFTPQGNPTMSYSAASNKKGKYFATGLFTPKEGDMWDITVTAEGYLPVHYFIESRNAQRVLAGDVMDAKLPVGSKLPEIVIRPLGHVRADFTMAPESELVQAGRQSAAEAATEAAAQAAATAAAAPAPAAASDPWVEALTKAKDGDLEAAVPLLQKAVELAPDDAERRATQAKVLYGLERYGEASAAAARAIGLDPARTDARKVLASAQIEEGKLDQAAATLKAALELAPDDIDLLERHAHVASQQGDSAGAIAAYESITAAQSGNVNAWLALAGLYARAGDRTRSEQAFQRVADLNPADAHQTFYNLGVLIMNDNDRNESDTQRAIDAFRKAVEIKPDYGQAYQQLGYALLGVGDQPGALAALESFLKVAPNAPDASRVKGLVATLKKKS